MFNASKVKNSTLIGVELNLISLLFSSIAPILNKFALVSLNPIIGGFFTSFFAMLLTGGVVVAQAHRIAIIKNPWFFLLGATNAMGVLLQYVALSLLSPVTVTLIARIYLVYVFFLGWLFLKEGLQAWDYVAIITCIAGSILVSGGRAQVDSAWGLLCAFLYPFMYAANNVIAKALVKDTASSTTLFYNHLVSAVVLLVCTFFTPQVWQGLSARAIAFNFGGALCNGFMSLLLFYTSLKCITAGHANIVRALGPLIVIAYSAFFFPISITPSIVGGAILLIIATAIVTTKHQN